MAVNDEPRRRCTRESSRASGCPIPGCRKSGAAMTRLLHITADFPDRLSDRKPLAVANLIATAPWAKHMVVSLNRVVDPWFDRGLMVDERGVAATEYFGLPLGLGLSHWMGLVAHRVLRAVGERLERPDLVHAHKLTFEGLAAAIVGRELGVPYCITVRGHTDHKVIAAKPGLRRRYREVLEGAGKVFYLAPWSLARLEQQLGLQLPGAIMLPNVCTSFHEWDADVSGTRRFVSVFHFRSRRVKRIDCVLRAMRLLQDSGQEVGLDVIGAADQRELDEMSRLAQRHGVADSVKPMMAMSHTALGQVLPRYAGLVLPSYPETFGLAYVEALSAGIPVIHARGSGIDGYFDDQRIAIAVDHGAPSDLARAMASLLEHQVACRERIRDFTLAGGLDIFTAESVGKLYERELAPLLTTSVA